jgi:hypothetical protein
VRWNLSMVLICISFMARDSACFFMWFFLAIWTSSFESSVWFSCPLRYWFIDFGGVSFFELPAYSGYQFFDV